MQAARKRREAQSPHRVAPVVERAAPPPPPPPPPPTSDGDASKR